ncbi:hypothetical protein RRG08_001580 [Elysia crispata]|uniref:Uncharacterized protein n=1 Tax=Elysia crispata TaxID=231223 RepID=A0AAE1AJW6_9GAST|nr:hypothetical protein RRG08_001580 [Elysia crispata]
MIGRQTTEHVLSSCKIAFSQGRYTWRHNRVPQELAAIISTAKGETNLPKTIALVQKAENCLNLTKEDAGYKAVVMPAEGQLAKWYSAWISNPLKNEGVGSKPGSGRKKKITGRHLGVMTWVWPGPFRVSEVQG